MYSKRIWVFFEFSDFKYILSATFTRNTQYVLNRHFTLKILPIGNQSDLYFV
nr:AlNc14C189G8402 [Albugo laibachii Nc14]|eukprot:CCA23311.1 AlNc14C189G8402 [Albugo laibachii Nc14]